MWNGDKFNTLEQPQLQKITKNFCLEYIQPFFSYKVAQDAELLLKLIQHLIGL